jgi:tetratricopeptide (TPR) repeat protein
LADLVSDERDGFASLEMSFPSPLLAFLESSSFSHGRCDAVRGLPLRMMEYLRDLSEEMDHVLKPNRLRTYERGRPSKLVKGYLEKLTVYEVFKRESDLFSRALRSWGGMGELSHLVWPIPEAVWSFYNTRRWYAAGLELLEAGSGALRRSASEMAISRSLMLKANFLAKLGKLEEARHALEEAGEIVERSCRGRSKLEIELEASFYEFSGSLESRSGSHALAIDFYSRSIKLSEDHHGNEGDFSRAIFLQCKHLAIEYEKVAQPDMAKSYYERFLSLCDSVEDHSAAGARLLVAQYCARTLMWAKVKELAEKSLSYYCSQKEKYREALACLLLAQACGAACDDEKGLEYARRAYRIFSENHLGEELEEAKAIMDSLSHPLPARLWRKALRWARGRGRSS